MHIYVGKTPVHLGSQQSLLINMHVTQNCPLLGNDDLKRAWFVFK